MCSPPPWTTCFQGRFEIISIGFVIALWSGSRAVNVLVDTSRSCTGWLGTAASWDAALSFSLYVIFLVAAVILLPLVLAGPGLVDQVLPDRLDAVAYLYWPVVLLGTAVALASLYHLAVPVRKRWRSDLPEPP